MKQPVGCFQDAKKEKALAEAGGISCAASRGFLRTIINI